MARSAWKFILLYEDDFTQYFDRLLHDNYKFTWKRQNRDRTINLWNYYNLYKIHNGKIIRKFSPSIYTINYKFGMFSKTRKPFFFRSKKKKKIIKNVTKKILFFKVKVLSFISDK